MSTFPAQLARWVTTHRGLVLVGLLLVTGALGAMLPRLRADPSPRGLVAALEGHEAVEARFTERFGDVGEVVVLLVQSDTLLERAPLEFVRQASAHFSEVPYVERVESLASTPLARRRAGEASAPGDDGLTLDDLSAGDDDPALDAGDPGGDGLTLDDLDAGGDGLTLDDLDGSPTDEPAGDDDLDPDTLDALGGIVRAEPTRFPMGLSSLANLTADIDASPVLPSHELTDEDVDRARAALAGPTLLDGRLVSEDRTVAGIALFLANITDHRSEKTAVGAIRDWLGAHPPPDGVTVQLAGLPYLHVSIVEKMAEDQLRLVPLVLLICLVVLFGSFRWWPAVVLSLGAVIATAIWVLGGMAIAGEKITLLNNILPALLIIIGISYSIHLLGRYREELRAGRERIDAVRHTVEAMTVGIFLTAATTAVGLGSLVVAQSDMIRRLGVTAGLGVMAAFVVTLLLLPAALAGIRARWPAAAAQASDVPSTGTFLEGVAVALARFAIRRRRLVVVSAAVLFVVTAAAATRLRADSAVLDQFDPSDPAYAATRLQEEKLAGVRPLEVVLTVPEGDGPGPADFLDPAMLAALDEVARWAETQPEVISATSVSDFLHGAWFLLTGDDATRTERFVDADQVRGFAHLLSRREEGPVDRYLADDGRTARLEIRLRDVGARASMRFIDRLTEELDRVVAGAGGPAGQPLGVELTGEAYVGSLVVATVVQDMLSSVGTAVFIIFGFIIALLRSPRLGMLSMPPNILPLTVAMALMVLRDIPLNAATAITFSVSLGMAVDGSIHLLARFREEQRRGRTVDGALLNAARGTGRAIIVSNLTLMAGFAVLAFSGFVPIRRFGELIAATIAATTFTTLLLLPALLRVGRSGSTPPAGSGSVERATVERATVGRAAAG